MQTLSSQRRKCKKCNTGVLDTRVKRPLFIKVLFFWLNVKRYKCDYCNKSTYCFDKTTSHKRLVKAANDILTDSKTLKITYISPLKTVE
jgi:hypothetical protein